MPNGSVFDHNSVDTDTSCKNEKVNIVLNFHFLMMMVLVLDMMKQAVLNMYTRTYVISNTCIRFFKASHEREAYIPQLQAFFFFLTKRQRRSQKLS